MQSECIWFNAHTNSIHRLYFWLAGWLACRLLHLLPLCFLLIVLQKHSAYSMRLLQNTRCSLTCCQCY